jgi:hypothetical protein
MSDRQLRGRKVVFLDKQIKPKKNENTNKKVVDKVPPTADDSVIIIDG